MKKHWKQERLEKGETFETAEAGRSMSPRIKHMQKHILAPVKPEDVNVDDIVFCKVKGRYYTHLVKAKQGTTFLVGNMKGAINGWTKQVYGKVIKIL
jgi:hypothetical protein